MAGKPGRSGGARPGAGRPPKEPNLSTSTALLTKDPKDFLTAVMNDPETDMKVRTDAAKALMPYVHGKIGEQGKKGAQKEAAKGATTGRFAPSAPPPQRLQ
jgi:phage terminase small subunit